MFSKTRWIVLVVCYVQCLVSCKAVGFEGASSKLEGHVATTSKEASLPRRKLMRTENAESVAAPFTEEVLALSGKPSAKKATATPKRRLAAVKSRASTEQRAAAKKVLSKQKTQKHDAAKKTVTKQELKKIQAKKRLSTHIAKKAAARQKRKLAAKKLPAKSGSQVSAKRHLAKNSKPSKQQSDESPARAEAEEEQKMKAAMNRPSGASAAQQTDEVTMKIPVAHPMQSARTVRAPPISTSFAEKSIIEKNEIAAPVQHEEKVQSIPGFPWKATPVCEFEHEGRFNTLIRVFVNPDNTRAFVFDLDNHGSQTKIQCHGATPDECSRPDPELLAKGDLQDCFNLDCACHPVTLSIDSLYSHYVRQMANHVGPICSASGGARILNIGLGGAAIVSYLLDKCAKGTRVVSVEKDPRIIAMASRFFGFKAEEGRNEVENSDASDAVDQHVAKGLKYDVVLVDCFEAGGMIPKSCRDWHFVDGLNKVLNKGGLVVQQVWAQQYSELVSMYEKVFTANFVSAQPVDLDQNVLVLASKAKH